MKKHVESVHLKSNCVKCDQCNKTLSTKSNLTNHIKKVHEKKTTQCDLCGKSVVYLPLHKKHVHENIEKSYQCNECDTTFKLVEQLKRHVEIVHLNIKPFKCETCFKEWPTSGKLTRHIDTVHLNKKNYHCPICDTSFKSELKRHMKSHHVKDKNQSAS